MSIGYMVLVIPICISILFSGTMLSPELEVTKVYGDEHTLDAQIKEISKIEPSTWDTLDVQEKLNVCQIIVNAEAQRLGIPHEVKVGTAYLEIGNLAYYQDKDYQIVIDSDYLYSSSSGYDICEVLIHECAHAYQHEIVEIYEKLDESERNLLIFHDAGKYLEEFRNYKSGSANFEKYYEQLSETHARLAAEEGIIEYKEKIEEYLSEKGKE